MLIDNMKKLFTKQHELGFDCCFHFTWDSIRQHADNLVKRNEYGYECAYCEIMIDNKNYKAVENLVKYLNDGGRNDMKLKKLSRAVEAYEWAEVSRGHRIENGAVFELTSESLKESIGMK